MSFHGAVRLLLMAARHGDNAVTAGDVPEIARGAFAGWAYAERQLPAPGGAAGDACRLPDGGRGRLVEVLEDGELSLVCEGG